MISAKEAHDIATEARQSKANKILEEVIIPDAARGILDNAKVGLGNYQAFMEAKISPELQEAINKYFNDLGYVVDCNVNATTFSIYWKN